MERVGVGILGLGTVGSGVARLLVENGDRISRRAGRRIELRRAVVRDRAKDRGMTLPEECVVLDPRRVIDDPEVQIVVETMGG
ncbi:homoserine dehydrogenase, partial [Singulisphaera rosea]